jgi:IclR family pca regulon transcriptional regulator
MARLRPADAEQRRSRDSGPDFLEALARGLTIITAFDGQHRQLTLSDVARAVDLPRATARRALYTLTELGYVESDGRLFRLTPRILRLAAAYLGSSTVATVLAPACERLSLALDEACSAASLDGDEAVMIVHASPQRFLSGAPSVGFRGPSFCSALGRVLLSGLPDPALDAFLGRLQPTPLTPRTLTDKAAIAAAVRQVRSDGFALVDQEVELGFRSIAVPVRRHDGRLVAALNIGTRMERADLERMTGVFLPALSAAAAELQPQIL